MLTRNVCPECGSDCIQAESWVSLNDDLVLDFVESTDNYCGGCEEHVRGCCEVDVATGECVVCGLYGDDEHSEAWKQEVKKLTPASVEADMIDSALRLLKEARNLLAKAGAPKSTARVRLAITSVKGAISNARHRAGATRDGRERKRIRRAPRVEIVTTRRLDVYTERI